MATELEKKQLNLTQLSSIVKFEYEITIESIELHIIIVRIKKAEECEAFDEIANKLLAVKFQK